MNILILGANGQLGKELQKKYPEATALDSDFLDITNAEQMDNFNWSDYDVTINAAAYTNVDGAETDDGLKMAWKVNGDGVKNIVNAVNKHGLKLVHISSDYVFDGQNEQHLEDEDFSPLNVYGHTKACADLLVQTVKEYYILRTTWVVGDGKNFVKTMTALHQKDISPTVVNDQIGRLTFTNELANAISHLLENETEYGTYNVTNDGENVSWAEIANEIYTYQNQKHSKDLQVSEISTEDFFKGKPHATRPLCSKMDLTKLHKTGFKSTNWREKLVQYLDEL